MPSIKPTCVRDIKLRVNIVDVISRVATLRKAGSRFKGLCPFHQEKSPSFHVDPDKGFYKCFGCGKAGDIISFVRETEQLTFSEAVEALGQRFAITIEYEEGSGGPTREERSLRQELFDLHEFAAEHYHQAFKSHAPSGDFMRTYWQTKRKFPLELADEFKIGVADATDNTLGAAILKKKYSEDALRQCGLFFIREGSLLGLGSLKPRFRGRLMIPIRDHQSRIVAFTARQTDLTPTDDPAREAKYVNSPETPIFTKGNLLFNLDRARSAVGPGHPFVVVEGQLDALRCWQVGLKTAIAPQGTAITETQLILLRRYHPEVECFFDSDSAGQKASLRFLPMALKAGLEIRFLHLAGADKIDPDLLFLERGLAAYEDVRKNALSAMSFACRSILPSPDTATPEQKTRASQPIFELIAATESQIARSSFISEASAYLKISHIAAQRDFDSFLAHQNRIAHHAPTPDSPPAPANTPTPIPSADSPEYHLLLMCLHFEQYGKQVSTTLPHDWIDTSHLVGNLLNRLLSEFEQDAWPGHAHLDGLLDTSEEKALVASLLFDPPRTDEPLRAINQALTQIRIRALEPKLRQIELALATMGTDSNIDAISLIKQRTDLQRQLRAPFGLRTAG